MNPQAGTVYIVDDDASVRRAALRLVTAEGFHALTFATAEEFLEYSRPDTPSCLVLDLQLPGFSGIELQEQLAARRWQMPIIFLSGHGDIPTSVKAIKSGATDFLCKPIQSDVLLSAIRQAISQHAESIQRESGVAQKRSAYACLTVRERQVMTLVVHGKLNKQIAGILGITEATVKVHRGRVMQKMGCESVTELVRLHDRLQQNDCTESVTATRSQ